MSPYQKDPGGSFIQYAGHLLTCLLARSAVRPCTVSTKERFCPFHGKLTFFSSAGALVNLERQVGNAYSMTDEQWQSDIRAAKDAHIDGFALNIALQDEHTGDVVEKAYQAAQSVGGFSLFLSFDYASGGPWPANEVITTINKYKDQPAQYRYQGKPMVSTFEGGENSGDWPGIKSATGCFLIPAWTSMGTKGLASVHSTVDGFFSWNAWPVGAEDMSDLEDKSYVSTLTGKPYMMPVSPWFYTNLPQWDKNWLWRGDDLWHERWQQAIQLQPDLVEVSDRLFRFRLQTTTTLARLEPLCVAC